MNVWDILILLLVGAMAALAWRTLRRKPRGGCGCASCTQACPHRRRGE